MVIGGQGPMYTFYDNDAVHAAIRDFYEAGKPTAVICHGTCALLKTQLSDGSLLVDGKTWTGFANSEEDFADDWQPDHGPAAVFQRRCRALGHRGARRVTS
jgi:putative intracellular protease/amidase